MCGIFLDFLLFDSYSMYLGFIIDVTVEEIKTFFADFFVCASMLQRNTTNKCMKW